MTAGDDLSTAVETVEELSLAFAEFAPGRLGPWRDVVGSLREGQIGRAHV